MKHLDLLFAGIVWLIVAAFMVWTTIDTRRNFKRRKTAALQSTRLAEMRQNKQIDSLAATLLAVSLPENHEGVKLVLDRIEQRENLKSEARGLFK